MKTEKGYAETIPNNYTAISTEMPVTNYGCLIIKITYFKHINNIRQPSQHITMTICRDFIRKTDWKTHIYHVHLPWARPMFLLDVKC